MALAPELTELSIERLRERRSAKWTLFEADVLPAWVAEMDFPLAPPIKDALAAAVDLDDTGYANPDALRHRRRRCAASPSGGWTGRPTPSR